MWERGPQRRDTEAEGSDVLQGLLEARAREHVFMPFFERNRSLNKSQAESRKENPHHSFQDLSGAPLPQLIFFCHEAGVFHKLFT